MCHCQREWSISSNLKLLFSTSALLTLVLSELSIIIFGYFGVLSKLRVDIQR
jgi:hypothetical protein